MVDEVVGGANAAAEPATRVRIASFIVIVLVRSMSVYDLLRHRIDSKKCVTVHHTSAFFCGESLLPWCTTSAITTDVITIDALNNFAKVFIANLFIVT